MVHVMEWIRVWVLEGGGKGGKGGGEEDEEEEEVESFIEEKVGAGKSLWEGFGGVGEAFLVVSFGVDTASVRSLQKEEQPGGNPHDVTAEIFFISVRLPSSTLHPPSSSFSSQCSSCLSTTLWRSSQSLADQDSRTVRKWWGWGGGGGVGVCAHEK